MSEREMVASAAPPKQVEIYYGMTDGIHIFESPDLRGLHISDPDLERAFALVVEGVHALVQSRYGMNVSYTADQKFEDFKRSLDTESDDGIPLYASKSLLNIVAAQAA